MDQATEMPGRIRVLWAKWHPEERAWLEKLRATIQEEYDDAVQRMVLFGSKARGDWHEESDVDVLVIVSDAAAAKKREIRQVGARLAAGTMVVAGVVTQTEREWKRMGAADMNWHAEVERQGVSLL